VILDPLHFGSASSAYDIFSFNQPLVTMPGQFAVGRIAAAFCRRLGMEELVAASPDEYVEKAVRVAIDREYGSHLRQRIAAASDRLFDDGEVVREHARFFADVLTRE